MELRRHYFPIELGYNHFNMAWNESGNNKNPWERRPQRRPEKLDEMLHSWQRKLAGLFGGGGGRAPGAGPAAAGINWGAILLSLATVWGATGFYIVDAAERGVILRFGRYVETTNQGPHWHWPWPIESVLIVDVARNESIEDKTRMLTADENLVDITIAVQYLRADPISFLFKVRDPEETLRDVSESAIREIVGRGNLDVVLGAGRADITDRTKTLIQHTLGSYGTGIDIISVNLTAVNVPDPVAPSQKDAIKAREDRDRFGQEAQAYANDILPKARGMAARQMQDAQAYRWRVAAEAEGETARFSQLLAAYERAPKVTRERLYLETVESVLSRSRKVLLDAKPGNMLYLPLDKLAGQGEAGASTSALTDSMPTPAMTPPPPEAAVDGITVDSRSRKDR
jgi:membrane protease subunit HflK